MKTFSTRNSGGAVSSLICSILFLSLTFVKSAFAAPLNNTDVIKMVGAGLGEATIIQIIDTSEPAFDITPDGLLRLKQGNTSNTLIQHILSRQNSANRAGNAPAPASSPGAPTGGSNPKTAANPDQTGTIESIAAAGSSGGATGGIAGGLLGGLLGHQVGKGSGNTAATIGGAVAGSAVGTTVSATTTYIAKVRMADGSLQVATTDNGALKVGDRVRIVNGVIDGSGSSATLDSAAISSGLATLGDLLPKKVRGANGNDQADNAAAVAVAGDAAGFVFIFNGCEKVGQSVVNCFFKAVNHDGDRTLHVGTRGHGGTFIIDGAGNQKGVSAINLGSSRSGGYMTEASTKTAINIPVDLALNFPGVDPAVKTLGQLHFTFMVASQGAQFKEGEVELHDVPLKEKQAASR